jgi:outer membrane biosynthesis protein TonB
VAKPAVKSSDSGGAAPSRPSKPAVPSTAGKAGGASASPDLDLVDPVEPGDPPTGSDRDDGDADLGLLDPDDGAGTDADDAAVAFSAAKVRNVVDRHQIQLQRCYQQAAKVLPPSSPLQGRVDVQFVIMPNGTANNVRAVANSTGSDSLAGCVVSLIESWEFPSPGAEEIAFVWPFVFRAP